MILPAVRKDRDSRSKWRLVRNPSRLFWDAAAPWCVVTRDLIKASIDADVLDGQLASGATDVGYITSELLEDWAAVQTSRWAQALIDGLLEDRVLGGIPTVLEVSMAGVSYGVASG